MPFARCLCGRSINVSLQGRNAPASPTGEFVTEAKECLSCGQLFCHDCAESFCTLCGGVVVEADLRQLALFTEIAPSESPCEVAEIADQTERASTIGAALHETDIACINELAEPGTTELLMQIVDQTREILLQEFGAIGMSTSAEALQGPLVKLIGRAYLCSRLLPYIPRYRLGNVGLEQIVTVHQGQFPLQDNGGLGPFDSRGAAGEALKWTALDQSLTFIELDFFIELGFEPSFATSPELQPLLRRLMVHAVTCFCVGVTEGIFRAGVLLTKGEHRRVHRRMAGHFLDHASTIIGSDPQLQDSQDVFAVVNHCLNDHRPDIRAGAKTVLWLAGLAPDPHPDSPDYGRGIQALGDGQLETTAQHFAMGSSRGDADATYALAILYEQGLGVEEDRETSRELLQAAANAGHLGAQGDMLLDGVDVARDVPRGIELLTRCAENGDVIAQVSRAGYSMSGELVPRDLELARRWLKTATLGGNPLAMFILADLADTPETARTE